MADVHSLNAERAKQANDCRMLLPVESLEKVAAQLKSGEVIATKSLVITLDDACGGYQAQLFASGLPGTDILALLEVAKTVVLQTMGYIR